MLCGPLALTCTDTSHYCSICPWPANSEINMHIKLCICVLCHTVLPKCALHSSGASNILVYDNYVLSSCEQMALARKVQLCDLTLHDQLSHNGSGVVLHAQRMPNASYPWSVADKSDYISCGYACTMSLYHLNNTLFACVFFLSFFSKPRQIFLFCFFVAAIVLILHFIYFVCSDCHFILFL